jgi:hypothetical protein
MNDPGAQELVSGGASAGAALPGGLPPPGHASRHAHHVQLLPAHQQRLGKVRIILELIEQTQEDTFFLSVASVQLLDFILYLRHNTYY